MGNFSSLNANLHSSDFGKIPDKKIIKEGVINLTGEELEEKKLNVLNLRLKFVPTNIGK